MQEMQKKKGINKQEKAAITAREHALSRLKESSLQYTLEAEEHQRTKSKELTERTRVRF